MKKLIALILLAFAFTASAQTNIAYRVTVDGVNTSWSYDASGGKDKARIAGLTFAYDAYKATVPEGETPLAMGPWLKRQHTVLIDDYAAQKQKADTAVLLAKLTALLTANTDLLSKTDMDALTAVAAKAP